MGLSGLLPSLLACVHLGAVACRARYSALNANVYRQLPRHWLVQKRAAVLQDRADIVARKMVYLIEKGRADLAARLNDALIHDRRFKESAKLAGAAGSFRMLMPTFSSSTVDVPRSSLK